MYQSLPPITEALETLQDRLRRERDPKRKVRLHLLVLLKAEQVTSRGQAATYLAVHRNTVGTWLRRYRDGGLETLLTYKEAGAPSGQKSLPPAVFAQLQARLATSGFASYVELQQWVRGDFGLEVPYPTLHGIVRYQLQAKLKRPRPSHAKKHPAEAADFVKQCPRRLGTIATLGRQTPTPPVRVFCQDESRLGLHLPVRRRLTGYGVKPLQGVEPLTGEAFWWELPRLDAACFTVFLQQFGQHYAESLNLVLLDQAPAHVAQRVQIPEHVVLGWLPAYRPELNPVERLWEDLKRRIDGLDGQVRSSLGALQAHVAGLVQRYTAETIASLTGYA